MFRSEAIKIDGRAGWLILGERHPGDPNRDSKFAGDHVILWVVVRDGENWGMFFGAAPIGDQQLTALLERTVAGLESG